MSKLKARDLTTIGICLTINIIGSFIVVESKIPLLLDHIGSIVICLLYGPIWAVLGAATSCTIVAMTFDWYALPFAPTGMLMVFLIGIFRKYGIFKRIKTIPAILLATLPGSILGAFIAGYLFGGITSSGSSIIVRFLINIGVNPAVSVFIIQYIMEFFDRLLSYKLAEKVVDNIGKI